VTYFCFIESEIWTTPHMEPLESSTPEDAMSEAVGLMRQHSKVIAAHVFQGEERVGTLIPEDART
jgi:hypothetical protein